MLVDAPGQGVQHGAVEGPVVVDPASHLGIDSLGEAGQVRAAATVEVPGPDLTALRFLGRGTHGRHEADEEPSPAPDQPTPESVAQEVEAGVLRLASAIRVLAVHDLRLRRVQLKPRDPSLSASGLQLPGWFLGVAVDNNVIRVALERAARVFPGPRRAQSTSTRRRLETADQTPWLGYGTRQAGHVAEHAVRRVPCPCSRSARYSPSTGLGHPAGPHVRSGA